MTLGNESQLSLQLGVKNLADEEYHIPNNSSLSLGVGPPRTAYATLGLEF